MEGKIKEVLFTAEQIRDKIHETAKVLAEEYRDKNPVIVCTLKGAFIFCADLVRAMDIPCNVDFISASSYGSGTVSSGDVIIKKDLDTDIKGRHVLILEDIIDTGNTLFKLKEILLKRSPASLKICTLLDKPSRRTADIDPDVCLFTIPDKFVIGYGLDVAEEYRQLPYIGVFEPTGK